MDIRWFYHATAVQSAISIDSKSVCLSVCLSVCRMTIIQTAKLCSKSLIIVSGGDIVIDLKRGRLIQNIAIVGQYSAAS